MLRLDSQKNGVWRTTLSVLRKKDSTSQVDSQATPTQTPTPTPTPPPLTFEQMNEKYGPCARVSVLMYHHIQRDYVEPEYLTVTTETFHQHLQYLTDKGYQTIWPEALVKFFDQGETLPSKAVLLTFDDGYFDFFTEAYPVIKEFHLPATVFVITDMIGQPGYLTWETMGEMQKSGLIFFANHTTNHKNVQTGWGEVEQAIASADIILKQAGSNIPPVFCYPYGLVSQNAIQTLENLDYKLAFTTQPGIIHCKKQRLTLPRIRVGNGSLSVYGL